MNISVFGLGYVGTVTAGCLAHQGHSIAKQGLGVAAQKCATMADLAKCVTPRHQVLDVNDWPELRNLTAKDERFCW